MRAPRLGLIGNRSKVNSLADKLAARTIPQVNGCWEMQGYPIGRGYVQIAHEGRVRRAHVVAWELANLRTVPKGLEVMHSCDNPRCVNPAHLSVGTRRENHLDAVRKGRKNAFGRQKLNAEQVREIRALSNAGRLQRDIARQFNIARNTVSGIVNRKTWDHIDRPFVPTGANAEAHTGESLSVPDQTRDKSIDRSFV